MGTDTYAVIGGGIIGCLVARHILDQRPGSAVTLIERDTVGCGASRRSAGLHFPRGRTDRVRRMSMVSEAFYRELVAAAGQALPIHPIGMSVLSSATDEEITRTYCGRASLAPGRPSAVTVCGVPIKVGPDASLWDITGAQYAEVGRLVASLVRRLLTRLAVREGVRVTALEPGADGVLVRLGTGEELAVDRVVLAPGPWLAQPAWTSLLEPLGVRVKKIVALHIERPPRPADRALVLHDEDAFLLPVAGRGHWLFSYTCQDWDVDPDHLAAGLSGRDVSGAHDCLRRYAPDLVDAAVSGRVFCDAYSADGAPVVRALDADHRMVFAGAANGSGYRLAPAIAAEALLACQPSAKGTV
jgi:glycine/D-amino acid oxidase-like deaminating enzyme